ncbi:MAG: tripartite tricarboxylate transporter substrate binding protein [Betaproteobacteria bacterium]|nr:tripartite tricarboxylate transporter substrate binding protein [Betaproteobacteria bacterium]
MKRNRRISRCLMLALLGTSSVLCAQDYPNKPVRLIVGFAPGGGTDVFARIIGNEMTKAFNQQVIVDNRSGANGVVAATLVSRASPDGYTVMIILSSHVINALSYKDLKFDVINDFTPVTALATTPYVLTVNTAALPVNTVQELIALAKAKPGAINYASAGNGSIPHLFQELMNSKLGIQITHVPFNGSAPALTDQLGGRVPLLMQSVLQCMPHLKSNRLKALAITAGKRNAALPDVPTLAESGVPGYDADQWWAMVTPKGLPKPIQTKLHTELVKIVLAPKTKEYLASQGLEAMGTTPEQLSVIMKNEYAKWVPLFKSGLVKPEQ